LRKCTATLNRSKKRSKCCLSCGITKSNPLRRGGQGERQTVVRGGPMLSIELYHTVRQKRTPKFPPSIRSRCSSSQCLSQNISFTCFTASSVFTQGTKMEEPIAMFPQLTSIVTPSGAKSYVLNTFIVRVYIKFHNYCVSGR